MIMVKVTLLLIFLFFAPDILWAQTKVGWLQGSWRGTGYQLNNKETWTMQLNVRGKLVRVSYPSLKCRGEWQLISWNAKRAKFREQIKRGINQCEPTGNVTVRRLSRQSIKFSYYYLGNKKVVAYGVLRRRS